MDTAEEREYKQAKFDLERMSDKERSITMIFYLKDIKNQLETIVHLLKANLE